MKQAAESPAIIQQEVSSKELMDPMGAYKLLDWHLLCRQLVEKLPGYPTGEPKHEAFWRTLMCNRAAVGLDDAPQDDPSYRAWVRLVEGHVRLVEFDSQTKLMRRVGSATLYVFAAMSLTRFPSTWTRRRWLSALAFIPVNYAIHHLWNVCLNRYALRMNTKHMQRQNENQILQREFEFSFSQWSQGRKFGITKNGFIGWIPAAASEDDRIVLFQGCQIPFVLRPYKDGNRLIGDCYIHGLMDGVPFDTTGGRSIYKIY